MKIITDHIELVVWSILGVIVFMLIIMLILSVRISRLQRKITKMLGTSGDVLIEDAIINVQQMLSEQKTEQIQLRQMLDQLTQQMKRMKARSAVVRYNAFQETGSDLSFSIAVVDEGGNGHVLTGIRNRHETQVYAKPLVHGQSKYSLSPEEKEAINQALQDEQTKP